ncbi:hypothetical protein PUN28_001356 [Cardiocondyla obscurior]|uniref:Uncharacterized protein n=1 Tax=Cardiocondyla obscurior TaxID=286306 RepID=A0AAW2H4K7_9HYME
MLLPAPRCAFGNTHPGINQGSNVSKSSQLPLLPAQINFNLGTSRSSMKCICTQSRQLSHLISITLSEPRIDKSVLADISILEPNLESPSRNFSLFRNVTKKKKIYIYIYSSQNFYVKRIIYPT